MLRRIPLSIWRRRRAIAIVLAALVILTNTVAYMQARSLTHFVDAAARPPKIQDFTLRDKLSAAIFGVSIPRPRNTCTPAKYDLPYDTCTMVSADGTRLEGWHIPADHSRGIVLLFHGYIAAKCSLLNEAKIYHDLGYDTLLVDFRGSGGSQGDDTTIGYAEADDVAAAVKFARNTYAPRTLILAGQSMGAAAILRAMNVHDLHPDALVLECPFDRLLTTVGHRCQMLGIPTFPAADLLLFWGSVQQGHWAFKVNPIDGAADVHCPTLLMNAMDDPFVRPSEAKTIFARLAGPKRDVWFDHVGHDAFLPKYPQAWRDAVTSFLNDMFQ
jgi:alpha-beta hydrolase superfamily lysophospholipase